MFLCYLIDPDGRSITKVNDGFDRASELTGSEHPGLAELWTDLRTRHLTLLTRQTQTSSRRFA
ncbi:hypothetical protein BSFA1_74330 (plasmid) [Burkholderia sp. SFA1]|nr:hypothetical protein BSFA1_74330 [Burkholderia sp. SFA1]